MFPIKSVQDYMYPQKLMGELAEQAARARLYGEQANWYAPKAQSEIDLINKGQIPHYLAMNDLIRSGQIPHYLAQNALIYQGQIPHIAAQTGLLGEQKEEQRIKNEFTNEQWKQWKTLQDEINRLSGQGNNQNDRQYAYPKNPLPLSSEQQRRIDENLKNSYAGTLGQITPEDAENIINNMSNNPNMQQATLQQTLNNPMQENASQRIADLKSRQQSLFGNIGKLGVETPFSKESRAEQLAEKKEDIKIYSQTLKSANEGARDATQMKNLINQFQNSYKKLENKGALLGRLPAMTSEQQIADNAAQNMQQMMVKLMKTNRMTNYELQFAGNLKLNRSMNPQTVKDVGDFLKAKSERLIEEPKFINAAKNKGISAEDAKVLWNEYENDRPVYNFEARKTNKDNLNTFNDYLTPEALNKVNGVESPHQVNNPTQNIEQEKILNGVRYGKVNGEWHKL